MKPTLTIKTPDDALAVVVRMLGFEPEESIVVLGIGGNAPTARVDLPKLTEDLEASLREYAELAVMLAPMREHLTRALVIVFTAKERHGELALGLMEAWLPGVEVVDAFVHVTQGAPENGRAARMEQCTQAATVEEAELLAHQAWEAGDGALAWGYLDRAAELGPRTNVGHVVERYLLECVPPTRGEDA